MEGTAEGQGAYRVFPKWADGRCQRCKGRPESLDDLPEKLGQIIAWGARTVPFAPQNSRLATELSPLSPSVSIVAYMKRTLRLIVCFAAIVLVTVGATAARVGDPAPDFTGTDTHGHAHTLADYRGKYVVLEWTNNGCPFTRKHYDSGNMQSLQKEWTARNVVWLTILSSAAGQQGYMTASEENLYIAKVHASPTAAILDPAGAIGHQYDAKTTPHMFVINPEGTLIYEGAIDDHATTDTDDVKSSKNYVSDALTQAMAGKQVTTRYTPPYGCGVKYARTTN
jgi:peroxiredoxin